MPTGMSSLSLLTVGDLPGTLPFDSKRKAVPQRRHKGDCSATSHHTQVRFPALLRQVGFGHGHHGLDVRGAIVYDNPCCTFAATGAPLKSAGIGEAPGSFPTRYATARWLNEMVRNNKVLTQNDLSQMAT